MMCCASISTTADESRSRPANGPCGLVGGAEFGMVIRRLFCLNQAISGPSAEASAQAGQLPFDRFDVALVQLDLVLEGLQALVALGCVDRAADVALLRRESLLFGLQSRPGLFQRGLLVLQFGVEDLLARIVACPLGFRRY